MHKSTWLAFMLTQMYCPTTNWSAREPIEQAKCEYFGTDLHGKSWAHILTELFSSAELTPHQRYSIPSLPRHVPFTPAFATHSFQDTFLPDVNILDLEWSYMSARNESQAA